MSEVALESKIEKLKRQEEHWQRRIVEAEAAYTTRSDELREALKEAEQNLLRVQQLIKEYETAQEVVRTKDEKRSASLAKREQELKAGWRALNQDRQDFELERKEFYKTRDLQT